MTQPTERKKREKEVVPLLHTVRQTAIMLNLSEDTIYRMISDKRLAAVRLSKRYVRISRNEIESFINKNTEVATWEQSTKEARYGISTTGTRATAFADLVQQELKQRLKSS